MDLLFLFLEQVMLIWILFIIAFGATFYLLVGKVWLLLLLLWLLLLLLFSSFGVARMSYARIQQCVSFKDKPHNGEGHTD